jgi:hypothetical protein
MEEISERDSENMTSARQRVAVEEAHGEGGPTFSHSYTQWRRPNESTPTLASHYVADPFKPKFNQTSHIGHLLTAEREQPKPKTSETPNQLSSSSNGGLFGRDKYFEHPLRKSPNFEDESVGKAKKQSRLEVELKERAHEQNYSGSAKVSCSNGRTDSHNKCSPKVLKPAVYEQSSVGFPDSINLSVGSDDKSKGEECIDVLPLSSYGDTLQQSNGDETNLLASKCATAPFASNSESLFTSPELLAECRNFLKLKSAAKLSTEKEHSHNQCMAVNSEVAFSPLKFDCVEAKSLVVKEENSNYNSNSESSVMSIFRDTHGGIGALSAQTYDVHSAAKQHSNNGSTNNYGENNQIASEEAAKEVREEPREPTFPNHDESSAVGVTKKHSSEAAYDYFHTFSGLSSQKRERISSAEEFVEMVLDEATTEPEGFIVWEALERLSAERCPNLVGALRQSLFPAEDEERLVLISNVGRVL